MLLLYIDHSSERFLSHLGDFASPPRGYVVGDAVYRLFIKYLRRRYRHGALELIGGLCGDECHDFRKSDSSWAVPSTIRKIINFWLLSFLLLKNHYYFIPHLLMCIMSQVKDIYYITDDSFSRGAHEMIYLNYFAINASPSLFRRPFTRSPYNFTMMGQHRYA